MADKAEEYQVSLEVHDLLRRVKIFVCRSENSESRDLQVVLAPNGMELRDSGQCTRAKVAWPDFKLKEDETLVLAENGSAYADCRMEDSGKLSFYQMRTHSESPLNLAGLFLKICN